MPSGKAVDSPEEYWDAGGVYDLAEFWRALGRRKYLIIGLVAAALLLSGVVVFILTPIYRATTTLLIESKEANIVSIEQVYGGDTRRLEYLATQNAILGSRPIAEAVVDKLGLAKHPEVVASGFKPFAGRMREKDQASSVRGTVDAYLQQLTIEPVQGTQLVRVHFDSPDPKAAAAIANQHAQAYVEGTLDARVAMTELAASWMRQRLEEMRQDLAASERRLQDFREQQKIVDAQGLRALPTQKINDLSARLVGVRESLSSAQISYQQVTRAGSSEDLQQIPAIGSDNGVRRAQETVARAEQTVAEIEQRYGPQHPRMIAAQAELASALQTLENQRRSAAERIRVNFEAARSQEAALAAELEAARSQYQEIGRKESQLNNLQRAVDTNRHLYELFYKRLSETTATEDLRTANARVVEPALVPSMPSKPRKGLIIALSCFVALVIGVAAALVLELVSNTIKSVSDGEERLKRPVLAGIPLLKGDASQSVSVLADAAENQTEDWRFTEAVRTIRTAIALDNIDKANNLILITSAVRGEGKSTMALNLARTFALSERTLLLDSDLRRPSIGRMAGAPRNTAGLSEVLADQARLKDCLIHTHVKNLDILPTGLIPPDPLQLLSSQRLSRALSVLSNEYTHIILDSPPLLAVSDAAVLSRHVTSVLMVVKAGSTRLTQVKRSLEMLDRAAAPVIGIALNQLDVRQARQYGDYGETYESASDPATS